MKISLYSNRFPSAFTTARIVLLAFLPPFCGSLSGKSDHAPADMSPIQSDRLMPVADNREWGDTLKMISAHHPLRTPEVADPSSETNRRILETMIRKNLPVPPIPPRNPATVPGPASPIVGTLDGSFSVDNHGAANYTISLPLPDGRAGLAPDLSISYDSGLGTGVLGQGFYFSTGFHHSIDRGRSLLARDDEVRGMEYSAADRFYLDGRRLVCTTASATYGKPGSTYRTEVDMFGTFTAYGTRDNIDTFVLVDTKGRKYTFGKYLATEDGYQRGFDEAKKALDPKAVSYALKRVEDPLGNYVEFSYEHKGFGEWVLTDIAYTGGPGIAPMFHVRFSYSACAPASRYYQALRRTDHNEVLNAIDVLAGNAGTPVAHYAMEYDTAPEGGVHRLLSISAALSSEVGQPLLALPPTRFHWSQAVSGCAPAARFTLPTAIDGEDGINPFAVGDFDGDGKTDYLDARNGLKVYLSTRDGFSRTPATWMTAESAGTTKSDAPLVLIGDFNGDGMKDVYLVSRDARLTVAVSKGDHFERACVLDLRPCLADPETTPGAAPTYNLMRREGAAALARITVADCNGDGRDDVLVQGYDGRLYTFVSNGSELMPSATGPQRVTEPANADWYKRIDANAQGTSFKLPGNYALQPLPCDINDDGMTDYAWVETERTLSPASADGHAGPRYGLCRRLKYVLAQPQGGWSQPVTLFEKNYGPWDMSQRVPYLDSGFCVLTGDFNGDGLSDFLVAERTGAPHPSCSWTMLLSRGPTTEHSTAAVGAFARIENAMPAFWKIAGGAKIPTFPAQVSPKEWVAISRPFQSGSTDARAARILGCVESGAGLNVMTLDLNHDGRDDFVWFAPGNPSDRGSENTSDIQGWWVAYSNGDGTFRPPSRLTGELWEQIAARLRRGIRHAPNAKSGEEPLARVPPTVRVWNDKDQNGDGLMDWIVECSNNGINSGLVLTAAATGGSGRCKFPNRVTDITNGYGSTISIGYKAAKDDSIYTPGAPVAYPIRELRSCMPVVSDLWRDNGTDIPDQFSYRYSGNRLDLAGRGGIGFCAFTTLDRETGFLKYQVLMQSVPMTGLAVREQTYVVMEDKKRVSLKLYSSENHSVVFDAVIDPFSNRLLGTVFPFTSRSIKMQGSTDLAPDFVLAKSPPDGLRQKPIISAELPASLHFRTVSDTWYDLQPIQNDPPTKCPDILVPTWFDHLSPHRTIPASAKGSREVPGLITYGNKTWTNVANSWGTDTRQSIRYLAPRGANDPLTGLVDGQTTTDWDATGHGTTRVNSYTYFQSTPLIATETTRADLPKKAGAKSRTQVTYTRDRRGRVIKKKVNTCTGSGSQTETTVEVPYRALAFDSKSDLPTSEIDADQDQLAIEYNRIAGEPSKITYPAGQSVLFTYNGLGRTVRVNNPTSGYNQTIDYEWTTSNESGWRQQQIVNGPSTMPCIPGVSTYAVRKITPGKPTVTEYYDRINRLLRTVTEAGNGPPMLTDTVFNQQGQVVAVSEPYAPASTPRWTTMTYDAYGVVAHRTLPGK